MTTYICNGCSVAGFVPYGVWFVLVMAVISAVLALLVPYATLAGQRRLLRWLQSDY